MAKKELAISTKRKPVALGAIGVILVIVGLCIIYIHNPLRGSGLGTISIVAGIVLLAIAFRAGSKNKK